MVSRVPRPARHRFRRMQSPSLKNWGRPRGQETMRRNALVDCGWGRLIFGQTFARHEEIIQVLRREPPRRRDIALYVWDPHVLIGKAPRLLFLDPSHTYRLWLYNYRPPRHLPRRFTVRLLRDRRDAAEVNGLYARAGMVQADGDLILRNQRGPVHSYFVAEAQDGGILGTVTGVDHRRAFRDPDNGASFWCLAVDPGARSRGVGLALVRHMAEHYLARGRVYLDLSVLHDNRPAIRLYQKLHFQRVPVYAVKRRNDINVRLYRGGPTP
jgi:ribosomal protein S18 acetylase RimI-like enzyme